MTKTQAQRKAQAFVEGLPTGTKVVITMQLPGEEAQVVSSLESNRDAAEGLRHVADWLSQPGDA